MQYYKETEKKQEKTRSLIALVAAVWVMPWEIASQLESVEFKRRMIGGAPHGLESTNCLTFMISLGFNLTKTFLLVVSLRFLIDIHSHVVQFLFKKQKD